MRIKAVVGVLAILAAFWVFGMINRDNFHRDAYMLCLGSIGESAVVSAAEKAQCACEAGQAVAAMSWKSRLPRSLFSPSADDKQRISQAQSRCRSVGQGS